MRHAMVALAIARPPQSSMMVRNPKTNAGVIALELPPVSEDQNWMPAELGHIRFEIANNIGVSRCSMAADWIFLRTGCPECLNGLPPHHRAASF